jgi:tRNA threonylcarbamoyl adenosine modification protein YjeE
VTIGPVRLDEPGLAGWGEAIGAAAARGGAGAGLVLALRGQLGAGKSVLARAVARGAGVRGPLPSPTFNLVFVYPGDGVEVWHLDLFRLEVAGDVWELGWRELGGPGQVVLIEWPERAEALLPADRWDIHLELPAGAAESAAERVVRCVRQGAAPALPAPVVAGAPERSRVRRGAGRAGETGDDGMDGVTGGGR